MPSFCDRPLTRLALIGAALAALTLAGCGRKGPLDPPPGASMAAPAPTDTAAAPPPNAEPLLPGQARDNGLPQAKPSNPNKKFFLDSILN